MAKVMIVDDSPTDVNNLKQMLVKAGYSVMVATNGQDALNLIQTEKPDCVVMDLVMPGVNGFQATRLLSRDPATQQIPIIVVSAKDQETDRLWAIRQGAREYIIKPVRENELLTKIKAVIS